jgi:hypothetical protein
MLSAIERCVDGFTLCIVLDLNVSINVDEYIFTTKIPFANCVFFLSCLLSIMFDFT